MEDIDGVMVPAAPSAAASSTDGKPQEAGIWPVEFEGVSVRVNGVAAPLFALVSVDDAEQINFQVPFELGTISEASIEIDNNGATTSVDKVPILPLEAAAVRNPRRRQIVCGGAARRLQPGRARRAGAARRNHLLYLTGLGPTDLAVPTNCPGPTPPATTLYQPKVRLDGAEQEVLGSYYAPQLTSVYQVNLRVGENTVPGDREIDVSLEGVGAQKLVLPVGVK